MQNGVSQHAPSPPLSSSSSVCISIPISAARRFSASIIACTAQKGAFHDMSLILMLLMQLKLSFAWMTRQSSVWEVVVLTSVLQSAGTFQQRKPKLSRCKNICDVAADSGFYVTCLTAFEWKLPITQASLEKRHQPYNSSDDVTHVGAYTVCLCRHGGGVQIFMQTTKD